MTVREKAPSILTEVGARRLTARIRDALVIADDLLADALAGRAWEALGYDDFPAYCAAELPELRHIKLRAPARQARAKALLDAGASEREIAAATGSSVGTAHNDVVFLTTGRKPGQVLKVEQPAPAQPVQATPPAPASGYRAAVALVAAQGAHGLTYVELCEQTGWRGGQATGALSKAHDKGLIRPTRNYRDGCASYVAL